MPVSYRDSWEKIQHAMQFPTQVTTYSEAESAYKIKLAIETGKHSRRLTIATWVLAVFTLVLAAAALLSYRSSQEQTTAINSLTNEIQKLPEEQAQLGKLMMEELGVEFKKQDK